METLSTGTFNKKYPVSICKSLYDNGSVHYFAFCNADLLAMHLFDTDNDAENFPYFILLAETKGMDFFPTTKRFLNNVKAAYEHTEKTFYRYAWQLHLCYATDQLYKIKNKMFFDIYRIYLETLCYFRKGKIPVWNKNKTARLSARDALLDILNY